MTFSLNGIELKLNGYITRKQGEEVVTNCPKCFGKSKLEINIKKMVFHCFRCSWGGRVHRIRTHTVTDINKADVIKSVTAVIHEEVNKVVIPPGYVPYNISVAMPSHINFLVNRNMTQFRVNRAGWGYSTEPKLRDRVIIPIFEDGKMVCYVARSIDRNCKVKELSPPKDVANRSHFIYNIDSVIEGSKVIVVEGIFDCEAVIRAGFPVTVAILGSHMSEVQIGKLLRRKPASITLLFDGDKAGLDGMRRAYKDIMNRNFGNVSMVKLPFEKDPDECAARELLSILKGE